MARGSPTEKCGWHKRESVKGGMAPGVTKNCSRLTASAGFGDRPDDLSQACFLWMDVGVIDI